MIAAVLFSTFSASIAFAVPEAASGITFFQTKNTHSGQAGSAERNQARIDGILYLLSQPGEVPAAIVNQMKADMAEAGRLFEAGDLDGAAQIMGRMEAGIASGLAGAAGAVQLTAAGARALAKITKTPIAYRQINAMGAEVTSADLPTGFTRVAHPNGDIVIMAPDGRVFASVDEIPVGVNNVIEGEVGPYGNLAQRSVKDGMTPDHIPSLAAVKENLRRNGVDVDLMTTQELNALRNNTNCVVVGTCDHQAFSRTYGGRNNQGQIQADAQDLFRAAEADLNTWEPVWRQNGWSDIDIANARRQVHEYNKQTFGNLGVDYGSN